MCLQTNIDRQARKLEEVRAQPHAPGPQGKAAKQKKIDKLDKAIKQQMAKELGGVRMKQTFLVSHLRRCAADGGMCAAQRVQQLQALIHPAVLRIMQSCI